MYNKFKLSVKALEYIEAVVYILAVVVVIFSNVYGNIYIKMIPLLFILGIIGNIFFDRQIITTTFGIVVAMCLIHLKTGVPVLENIFLSFVIGLQIILGEYLGKYIKKLYKYSKKSKKVSQNKLGKSRAIVFILLFLCIGVHMYINGSYLTLKIAKNTINSYFENKGIDEYKIINTNYNFFKKQNYQFTVNTNSITSKYIVYLKDIDLVIDEYNNSNINNRYLVYTLDDIYNEIRQNDIYDIYSSNYTLSLDKNNLSDRILCINKKVDIVDNNSKDKFISEILQFVKMLNDADIIKNIDILQISLSTIGDENVYITDLNLSYYMDYILDDKKAYEYIDSSLNMQYLDF